MTPLAYTLLLGALAAVYAGAIAFEVYRWLCSWLDTGHIRA
jgi:hypothetical protein